MYTPKPINTDHIVLSEDLTALTEQIAENVHEVWSQGRIREGWTYGEKRDDVKKETPCLVPYDELPEQEKDYDRNTAIGTVKLICSLGYTIEKQSDDNAANTFYVGKCDGEPKKRVYLSQDVVGGVDTYHRADIPSVFFVDEDRDLCRQIIDRFGNIRNFPGITYDDKLTAEYGKHPIAPIVRFGARFGELPDGNFLMVWTVRPDGRYWMDHDGFGAEDEDDVRLYTYIDRNGDFTAPFQLYSIGDTVFAPYRFR